MVPVVLPLSSGLKNTRRLLLRFILRKPISLQLMPAETAGHFRFSDYVYKAVKKHA